MLHKHCLTPVPFTKMYTLEEFASGKAWSPVKRENPCYFESKGTMKPESQGGENSAAEHTTYPTHWIVWNGPVTQRDDGSVNLDLFSWGDVSEQIKPKKDLSFFINRFFGGVVLKPLN